MENEPHGLLSDLYRGSIYLGQFRASLGMIIAVILGIILTLSGIYLIIYNDDAQFLEIEGIVIGSECATPTKYVHDYDYNYKYGTQNKTATTRKCNVTVRYEINNKIYSRPMFTNDSNIYMVGEPITILVDKTDFSHVRKYEMRSSTLGSIFISFAIVAVSIGYLNYYMTQNFDIFASAQGIGTVFDIVR